MRLPRSSSSRRCCSSEKAVDRYAARSSGRFSAPKVSAKSSAPARARIPASAGVARRSVNSLGIQLSGNEEEREREEQVNGKEHDPLEPGGFPILGNRVDDESRAGDGDQLDRIAEDEIHRVPHQV